MNVGATAKAAPIAGTVLMKSLRVVTVIASKKKFSHCEPNWCLTIYALISLNITAFRPLSAARSNSTCITQVKSQVARHRKSCRNANPNDFGDSKTVVDFGRLVFGPNVTSGANMIHRD